MTWHLSAAQRVANARKAARTRRMRSEPAFGGKHRGGWGHLTAEQRHERALKAAATRRARGEKPWGGKYGRHSSTSHAKHATSRSVVRTARRYGSSDRILVAAERYIEAQQQAAASLGRTGQ